MKRKVIIVITLTIIVFLIHYKMTNRENENINSNEVSNTNIEENITDNKKTEVDELKEQYNITGNSDIYNVETESDGRKVINVKPSVNFKVAFAGMIKKSKPDYKDLDSIVNANIPTKKGIWINKEDREKILTFLNNNEEIKCQYEINSEGYLKFKENEKATIIDKKIENLINGDNQYILCISSVCYMIDTVTGEIIDNPYNELEKYQTYEYFKDEDRMIIFITENKEAKMTQKEIFESILDLLDLYN